MIPTVTIFGHGYKNRVWGTKTVTLRFDENGYAEIPADKVALLDLDQHPELEVVDAPVAEEITGDATPDVDEDEVGAVGV
jgi:hypothetical protein